ncbi:MAG: ATP-dependent acyl-CoA ligase [Phenylobacterium sp.]|nr:MAG: ATP-dependent acyl-CoA ligase [Phenylobacterium sp.]
MPHPPWFEDRPPSAESCVVATLLARRAAESPEAICATFADGSRWTYGEAWTIARQAAAGLAQAGVSEGDRVLLFLPNGPSFLRAWFGASALGAVIAPLNVALRGETLRHAVVTADAAVMVCHAELAERLGEFDAGRLDTVILAGPGAAPEPLRTLAENLLRGEPALATASPQPWDIGAVLFTSGTTGRSKGVLCPYAHLAAAGAASHGYLGPHNRIYIYTPMFHTLALGAALSALAGGASMHLAPSFSAKTLWADVQAAGCNRLVGLLSSITSYLAASVDPDGKAPFDFTMMSPITPETAAFAKRQGFSYFAAFSMTEVSVPILTAVDSQAYGSCGRPRDGIEARIVDAHDQEVEVGAVGELILRASQPWTMNAGYLNDPAATAAAWRNGWFHTGDAFRRDAAGDYYFVDRMKDAIRRRGENISSQEVEREIAAYPGVLEVAVIGVPSPHGDQEVMAVIAPEEGAILSPEALTEFLAARCAHFMVPRFFRFMPVLPKTSTNKVTKEQLRRDAVTGDSWDREAQGLRLRARTLTS